MPRASNPDLDDHFVYVIHANDYPFYVGHGHSGRLSDRPVYIDRLVRLHPEPSYCKWTPHGLVVAALWAAGIEVFFDQITERQIKREAAVQEERLIQELLDAGFLLTNDDGNPRGGEPDEVAAEVLRRARRWEALETLRPVNRYTRPIRPRQSAARLQGTSRVSSADLPF